MKQVQRSNDDPSVFEISYRGEHTCVESRKAPPGVESSSSRRPDQDQSLLLSFQSLKVETDVGSSMEEQERSSFTFAPTPASGFSPPFASPTTPHEPKCFSPSATHAGTASELAERVAAAAPAPANEYDSYTEDLNLLLDSGVFDPNFHFEY